MAADVSPAGARKRVIKKSSSDKPSLRQTLYIVLEEGQTQGMFSRLFEIGMISLIVSNVLMVILETMPEIYRPHKAFFAQFETWTVYIFATEYLFRLWACLEDPRLGADHPIRARFRFAFRPMSLVDLLSFAPFFITLFTGGAVDLRALRILRLLRLLKLARYSQAMPAMLGVLYAERRALLGSFILLLCTVCITAEIMHLIEGPGQPDYFGTLPTAMYWSIETLSTVGYGDAVPHTYLGKLVAGITMVVGLVLFAMPIGIISVGFVNGLHRREFSITWSMVKRQPLFEDFDVEAVGRIVDLMGARIVQEHSRIVTAGQPAGTFCLVISGRARAEDDTGAWDLEAGDMIGDEAIDEACASSKTVTARGEMRLMVMPAEDLRRLCRKYPLLEQRIRNQVSW